MRFGQPISYYQARQLRGYVLIGIAFLFFSLVAANVIVALVRDSITISKEHYQVKEGFPLFTDREEYIRFIREYPYDLGMKLHVYTVRPGESYWNISRRYGISMNTLIGANPFMTNLFPKANTEIVVPQFDGVLFAFDSYWDVKRMKKRISSYSELLGEYLPTLFRIVSMDDIRIVFFKGAEPVVVNDDIERLYRLKNIFATPVTGHYTCFFGDRVHPFERRLKFHNGVDIMARYGTPITAAREGMVIQAGWRDGYGKTVMVQHPDGYCTLYGHCSEIKVKVGEWVTREDVIASIGSTGWSTGPHLHFTLMRHGEYVNPLCFIW